MIDLRGLDRNGCIQNIRLYCIGKPYGWDKMGPEQFDCSGVPSFSLCLLKKMNCQELYNSFKENEVEKLQSLPGTLWFYGDSPMHLTHVMTVLDHWPNGGMTLVGARGGDNTTITIDNAKARKAFVDVCDMDYWPNHFQVAVDPFQIKP